MTALSALATVGTLFNSSHQSVRIRLMLLDETLFKVRGKKVYIWTAIDTERKEVLALRASWVRDEEFVFELIEEVL